MEKNCRPLRRHRSRGDKGRGRKGFVLVELMIALVLSGFVMTMVFYSWKYISNHTVTQQRKAMFQTEADRIAQTIAQQIRKSPEVMSIASTSIRFLLPGGADTVAYEFENGSFQKNGAALWQDNGRARICQFDIVKEASSLEADTLTSMTILLTIGFMDRFGNAGVYPIKVRAAVSPDRLNAEYGKVKGWNF